MILFQNKLKFLASRLLQRTQADHSDKSGQAEQDGTIDGRYGIQAVLLQTPSDRRPAARRAIVIFVLLMVQKSTSAPGCWGETADFLDYGGDGVNSGPNAENIVV
ncbi:MAG: hypothetical protein LBH70_05365 [Spirochaetaceae bacterium]|jgi:hypothetical protein|nr:hypothetical protein [Spirochaetaceae bacterium]